MPEIKHYEVTQTRSVRVVANNEVDAMRIASAAFDDDFDDGTNVRLGIEFGYPNGKVDVNDITVSRERY